jgi:hypothetical protein
VAAIGVPSVFINPSAHPWLFAASLGLLILLLPVYVALQIIWSIRCKNELKQIASKQTLSDKMV